VWGISSDVLAMWTHLKDTLPYEEQGERKITFNLMVLLYNLQRAKSDSEYVHARDICGCELVLVGSLRLITRKGD
jgi:hypothetical protein